MPALDYSNPLFTFTSDNYTTGYTATQDCYLFGALVDDVYIYINNIKVLYSRFRYISTCPIFWKLSEGDTIRMELSTSSSTGIGSTLQIFLEK